MMDLIVEDLHFMEAFVFVHAEVHLHRVTCLVHPDGFPVEVTLSCAWLFKLRFKGPNLTPA